jgi:nitrate/TMAO reductase-like tetraheme cytochrome c subunit
MSIRSLPVLALVILGVVPCISLDDTVPVSDSVWDHQDRKPDPNSAKSCAKCHKAIYDEWNGRKHSHAWTNPIYQASIKKKKRAKMCHACHIPDRVLARVGRKPKTRKDLLHEGVTCVSCHEKGGKIHGPFGAKTDAHESVKDPLFTDANSSGLCLSCHSTKIDVVLPVGKDFKKAKLASKGKSCVGCHMPEIERHLSVSPVTGKPVGEKRKGRSHKLLGPNDPVFCATAFKLTAARKGEQMVLTIANEAGHRVPGLSIREFHFLVRQTNAAGKVLSDKKIVVSSENGLMVEETREFPFELAEGVAGVEVVIQHHFQKKKVADISKQRFKL